MREFNIYHLNPEGLENKCLLMEFVGEINNQNVLKFEEAIKTLDERKQLDWVVFDFTDLDFINSQAIGYLLKLIKSSQNNKQEIFLAGLKGQVAEVVELIGIGRIVEIFDNPGQAIDKIKQELK